MELVKLTRGFTFAGINYVTGDVLYAYASGAKGTLKVSGSDDFGLHLPPQLFGNFPVQ